MIRENKRVISRLISPHREHGYMYDKKELSPDDHTVVCHLTDKCKCEFF